MPFSDLDAINKDLKHLENMGVISKVKYSDWVSPNVYVKKKNNQIHVCSDFFTGLDNCLQDYNYILQTEKKVSQS